MSYAANPNKSRRTSEEIAEAEAAKQEKADRERIRRLIITLGDDTTKKVAGQIRGLAGALEDDVGLHGDLLKETALDCIRNLPLKTNIMAAWVARMAEKHERWAASVVERCLSDLRGALQGSQASVALLLLRFLVSLSSVGVLAAGDPGVLGLLREVMLLSEGLKAGKGGELGVFLVLASLPYLSPACFQLISEDVNGLLAKADAYMASRDPKWKQLLRPFGGDTVPSDRLESLTTALRTMKGQDWSSAVVLHVPGFQPSLEGRQQCSSKLEPLGLAADHILKSKFRLLVPMGPLRLAKPPNGDGAAVDAPLAEHDQWLLEDLMGLTIEMFGEDVDECGKQIMRIPIQHADFEATLVDVIFSQMLRLPHPTLLPLFYSRLLEVLVDKQATMRELVEKAFNALFQRVTEIDEESLEVLGQAFAYHLMCNSYEADWAPFTSENVPFQAQRLIRRAFERLQRLSFHTNLLHRLPDSLHVFVPPEPAAATDLPVQAKAEFARLLKIAKIKEPDEQMVFKFCRRLMRLEPTKVEPEERKEESEAAATQAGVALPVGEEAPAPDTEAPEAKRRKLESGGAAKEEPGAEAAKVEPGAAAVRKDAGEDPLGEPPATPWPLPDVAEILATAVLQNGSKTPTHMNKMLDDYEKVFLKLRPTDDDEAHEYIKCLVRAIYAFWRTSPQRLEITLDAMLHRGVLTPRAVVEHALECAQSIDAGVVWNMLNSCARKSIERITAVQAELGIAKRLEKTDVLEGCKKRLDTEVRETADLFTAIFGGLVRNYQDLEEEADQGERHVTLQRILAIGRKYHAFIRPLTKAAESRIPGVAHNPDIAAAFQLLRTL